MSAQAARHLKVVDVETGEALPGGCPHCEELEVQLAGAERDIRGWRARYHLLKRDKDAEAKDHPAWPQAMKVFAVWKGACNHPRASWNADRFWLVEPFLREHGIELCLRAIAGAQFDPYSTTRKNGTTQRHDGFELIFRNAGKFEEFCNRAPRDWAP